MSALVEPQAGLTVAAPDDLEEAVRYALRFDLCGKAHGKRLRDDPDGMANAVVRHLLRSNYRIFHGPPTAPHTAGQCTLTLFTGGAL